MSSNSIRFNIHTEEEFESKNSPDEMISAMSQVINTQPIGSLVMFSNLLAMFTSPQFEEYDRVVEESLTNTELKKKNISIQVKNRYFDIEKDNFNICSVCLEKFEDKKIISYLDCGHCYHPKCIKEWGCYNQSCPNCRKKIEISLKR